MTIPLEAWQLRQDTDTTGHRLTDTSDKANPWK